MDSPMSNYHQMKARCHHKNNSAYKLYGAKGIVVCEEWLKNPIKFVRWAEANGWEPGKHIHRINNAKRYSPETCEFVTPKDHTLKHKKIRGDERPLMLLKALSRAKIVKNETGKRKAVAIHQSTRVIRNIPDDIRRAFKAKCAMEGKSQQQRILELIEQDLKGGQEK